MTKVSKGMPRGAIQLSVKSRLMLSMILITMLTSFVVGYLGWRNGKSTLEEAIVSRLSNIRTAKAAQIQTYFEHIFSHTRSLSEDRMIVNAMKQFREGFNVALNRSISREEELDITKFYENSFTPKLAKAFDDKPISILYRPKRALTNYFQYHYLVGNPFPPGRKDGLVKAEKDTTIYNRFHQFYHPLIRNLQQEFDYYDVFLIDIKSLNIIYSVFKETDYATSLQSGPYRESGLGVLAHTIQENPERGKISVSDYRFYAPSYGSPAAFVGAPIFDGNEAIGILVVQLPVEQINKIMTNNRNWKDSGFGETGESYLVGSDQFMRSVSRSFIEDKPAFLNRSRELETADSTLRNIENFDTTILSQPVASSSTSKAYEDESGTELSVNYLGNPVLSSYSPLSIDGLDWIIVSEIQAHEAYEPIARLKRNIMVWGAVLVLGIAFLAMALSRYFVRPIEKLTTGVLAIANGSSDVVIEHDSNDEYGDLADGFNTIVSQLQQQEEKINTKTAENVQLVHNIFPRPIAEQLLAGETPADYLQQVSIAYVSFTGFFEFNQSLTTEQSANQLSELRDILLMTGEKFDVQIVQSYGTVNIVSCGVLSTRLDHAKELVKFSAHSIKAVHAFNTEHGSNIEFKIGVETGPVFSGVVGDTHSSYELWGETVEKAELINHLATPNSIYVSTAVRNRLAHPQEFQAVADIKYNGKSDQIFGLAVVKNTVAGNTVENVQ